MQSKRLFSRDPVSGVEKWFHYDDDTDQCVIETVQDAQHIVDDATRIRNNKTSLDRWGDGKHVGFVPMSIYSKWCAEGKLGDQRVIREFLNDPQNKYLRTHTGRV